MKSKTTAGLLAFPIWGALGIHRFYLGQIGLGIMYLLFAATGVPFIIAFIDFIGLLTMYDDLFNKKYNKKFYEQNRQYRRPDYRTMNNQEGRPSYNKYKPQYQNRPKREEKPITRRPKTNRFKEEGTRLYKEYDFKGAIKNYQQSLRIHPDDPIVHFNLACLYSLMEEPQHSYMHITKAIESGFVMYDKIKTHDHLAYLRTMPDFDAFVANGYKVSGTAPKQLPAKEEDEIDLMSDEVMDKLERLALLKDKGILTEVEFQKQKAKLLRKN
jgi:TM2 domain-containing membrane protein YozV